MEDITTMDQDFKYIVPDHQDVPQHDAIAQYSLDVPIGTPCRRCRCSKRLRKNGLWTDDDLKRALAAVDNGMNIHKASKTFHIPYSTLREWCYSQRTSRERGSKGVLPPKEEQLLVDWLLQMCEMGHGLSIIAFKLKVNEITKSRWTPFKNDIPEAGWLRWWQRKHPKLTLRASQALEIARARGLCEENVKSFYDNFQKLYMLHDYPPKRIWNCDEFGAQVGKNGGGLVIARTRARQVHSIVPDQREWLSVLVCINAAKSAIPLFYIFGENNLGRFTFNDVSQAPQWPCSQEHG